METRTSPTRFSFVRRICLFLSVAATFAAVGCGGSGTALTQISGVVFDINGEVVRGATIWCNDNQTQSNSGGIYMLSGVGTGQKIVHAEIWKNGTHYTGNNIASVFKNERSKSVNITVVAVSQQAQIHGVVRDRDGFRLAGARIFANMGGLSSQVALSDKDGNYAMGELAAGMSYTLSASGLGFDSDTISANFIAGEDRNIDFLLSDPTDAPIPPPDNLGAVAWTTPFEASRSPQNKEAYDGIKRLFDKRYVVKPMGRTTTLGSHVEVDLYWDPIGSQYLDSLLGFGIYRATTSNGASTVVDFLRDPQAVFYSDVDDFLLPGRAYYYDVTSLNVRYPDTFNSESNFSNRYGVFTLGDMITLPVTQTGTLRFHWQAAADAEEYMVFLFDRYPGLDVQPLWDNSANPTNSTSLDYTGPALTSGKKYYYAVLGLANSQDSRTLSRIGEFIAN